MKSRFICQWLEAFSASHTLRANSLIITIYGDAIAPHRGTVWLGRFIKAERHLGDTLETADGSLSAAAPYFKLRFPASAANHTEEIT